MFYQTDSVKTSYFTVKNYDGTFLPEMVDKAPESASYTGLTEIIISSPKISPMENNWYHLSPEHHSAVEVHDMNEMIDDTSKASYVHIIYMVKHLYDTKSGTLGFYIWWHEWRTFSLFFFRNILILKSAICKDLFQLLDY